MILPSSYGVILIVLFAGMLSWGTWANTLKAAGNKWRFELYYFDFAFGVVVAATLVALTFGNLGFDGFSFKDDLQLAGKRQDLFAFGAGAIFNLGNMLLLGALSLVGMAIAFPVGMGFALVVGVLWNYALNPGGNGILMFTGAAVVIGAVVSGVVAYRAHISEQLMAAQATKAKAKKTGASSIGIALALVGGLMLGSFAPVVQMARSGENGLGPYSCGFVFAVGLLFSTFVYNLFFMNLPVRGEPLEMREYFRAPLNRHLLGILGGIVWYIGAIASLLASRAEGAARVQPSVGFAFSQIGIIIAAICGLFLWREFAGADSKVKTYLGLMLVLLAIGIGLVSSSSIALAY
ncbi:MAG TPA: GRP family sugar transporter [Bryobacteraceae bacterium]|nr:GRP family sugar transporter [Bryobacteraceae bacterium]